MQTLGLLTVWEQSWKLELLVPLDLVNVAYSAISDPRSFKRLWTMTQKVFDVEKMKSMKTYIFRFFSFSFDRDFVQNADRTDRLPSEYWEKWLRTTSCNISTIVLILPFVFPALRTFVLGCSAEGLRFGHYKHSCESGGILRNVFAFFRVESASSLA